MKKLNIDEIKGFNCQLKYKIYNIDRAENNNNDAAFSDLPYIRFKIESPKFYELRNLFRVATPPDLKVNFTFNGETYTRNRYKIILINNLTRGYYNYNFYIFLLNKVDVKIRIGERGVNTIINRFIEDFKNFLKALNTTLYNYKLKKSDIISIKINFQKDE